MTKRYSYWAVEALADREMAAGSPDEKYLRAFIATQQTVIDIATAEIADGSDDEVLCHAKEQLADAIGDLAEAQAALAEHLEDANEPNDNDDGPTGPASYVGSY